MEEIKILGISTSPRAKGYTAKLLNYALDGAADLSKQGAVRVQTERYDVFGKHHLPCTACRVCKEGTAGCVLQDDMQALHEKMKEADGIIFATPVYYYDVTAQCKLIIDRSFAISPFGDQKAGAIITTASSIGTSSAISTLQMFFGAHGVTSAGWLSAYKTADEGQAAIETAVALGQKTAQLAYEKKKLASDAFGSFRHIAYGTHTI